MGPTSVSDLNGVSVAGPAVKSGPGCATALAGTLREAGVRYVFGHPGGEVLDVIDAVEQAGIQFVLNGHESAAAFMAGAIGRLTGSPGVCLSTLGPGACNLVLGVGNALLDRDPLLALSASIGSERDSTHTKQNLRLNDLFAPISKWSVSLNGVRTGETILSALDVARRAPRGPVFVSMSSGVAALADSPDGAYREPPPFASGDADTAAIVRRLKSARRPVAVIGVALDLSRDAFAVRRFLAETNLPFAVLPQAKGIADEYSERFLGTVCAGADDRIVMLIEQSDCLLGIGFDPVESAQDWHLSVPVCSVANSPQAFGRYQPVAESVGNVSQMLSEMLPQCRESGWTEAEIREVRGSAEQALCPPAPSTAAGLSPFHVIRTLRQILPEEAIVSADVGAHKMAISQLWRAPLPGSFLVSNGLSAMGYGVPAAMTASLLYPERPVVGVIGDGGFGMMVQELETARRLGIHPLFVVFCDRALAIVKIAQRARRIPHVGVDFAAVDWVRVAEGFGANAIAPGSLCELRSALEQWLHSRQLTVLAVPIDPDLYEGLSY